MRTTILFLVLVFGMFLLPARAEDPPYPTGSTSQNFAGLRFQLVIPGDYDPAKEYSLIVVLHGARGTETGMAGSLQPMAKDGFVVCAPKSRAATWSVADLKNVKEIIEHLKEVLSIGEKRSHCMGFSNGGWNLAPIAFDEKLHFISACWMAAGYNGGKVPRWAKKDMGAIALAGAQDGNRGAAEKTVDLLEDKVRTVECRIQPDLGHKFTRELMPYYFFWLKVMEGRFTPGLDLSFEWSEDPVAAREEMTARKRGGFFFFYSPDDTENPEAKRVQHVVFFDRFVRHFGKQLVTVKLNRKEHEELFEELKLKETPAVVVMKPDGKIAKSMQGKKVKVSTLAKALRSQAKKKALPK